MATEHHIRIELTLTGGRAVAIFTESRGIAGTLDEPLPDDGTEVLDDTGTRRARIVLDLLPHGATGAADDEEQRQALRRSIVRALTGLYLAPHAPPTGGA